MLAELTPTPDQVTIAINTNQMNIVEQMVEADLAGTSLAEPMLYHAYREMTIPAGPEWVEEHIRRLSEKGIQTHFQLANITQLETVERMMRRGTCNVPLILTWVAIGGGFDAPNIYNLANFVRATPDGAVLTLESSMLNVLPLNMMAMAMGLHVRCGIEDNIWNQRRTAKMGSVAQIEQLVRMSREFGRDIANGQEARRIYRIGEFYKLGRRDAGRATASRRTASPGSAACCSTRPSKRAMSGATVLIVPGLRDDVAEHWQTLLGARLPRARTVPPMGRADLDCAARCAAIEREAQAVEGPLVIVAHSGGVVMLAHWARSTRRPVLGALLATPPDFERPMPEGYPSIADARGRRLAAGAARAAAVPEHRRGQPQRPARRLRPRRGARARLGLAAGRPRRGRPPQPGFRLRRMADGRDPDRRTRSRPRGGRLTARLPWEGNAMSYAIRIHELGGPEVLRLEEVEVGDPGPGEARVRHTYIAVNFIDVYFRTGRYPMPLPNGLGSDAVGVVEAVGPGVTDIRPGDRVGYLLGPQGAYSEVRVMPADVLIPIPDGVKDSTAGSLMMKGMTAQYLFRQVRPLEAGETILYHAAAGGVGLIACQLARALGVTMIGTVSTDAKAEAARANGCAHVIVTSREDIADPGPRDHRRQGRAGGLRLGRQGHADGLARQPAAARRAGQQRHRRRARSSSTPRCWR